MKTFIIASLIMGMTSILTAANSVQGSENQRSCSNVTAERYFENGTCLDGKPAVNGYCRAVYFGQVTDCYYHPGAGLLSPVCGAIASRKGYSKQILEGLGGTLCQCYGAVQMDCETPVEIPVYSCPRVKTINCFPIVPPHLQKYCSGPYHDWIQDNCPDVEFVY